MQTSVAIRNETLTLEGIRSDSVKAAAELSVILKKKEAAGKDLADAVEASRRHIEEIAEERNKLHVASLELDERQMLHEKGKQDRKREIEDLDAKVKEANKLLQRIQGFIFDANAEYEKKQGELHDINIEIHSKGRIAEGILALQNEYLEEEKKRDAIRLENNLSIDNAKAYVAAATIEKNEAEQKRDEAIAAANEAERERQKTILEKDRIVRDLNIYVSRVEVKFKEAFPELHMIL